LQLTVRKSVEAQPQRLIAHQLASGYELTEERGKEGKLLA